MFRGKAYESDKVVSTYEFMKVKRYRSAFTTDQINYLEKQFKKCPYIGSATRKEVANVLNIPERAIKIWFQNRRMKEKKETNSKEHNLNRQNKTTNNNMEFAKDSLNNVHSSQSVNDRQCSSQFPAVKHFDTTNDTNYNDVVLCSNQLPNDSWKREKFDNIITSNRSYDNMMENKQQQHYSRKIFSEPENLSKYSLNKNYNNKNFVKYLEHNKKEVSKERGMSKRGIPSTLPRYQDMPEDLSLRNLPNVMISDSYQRNMMNSTNGPLCNTQNVCLSTGNMIWNPVNVMPVLSPNTLPVSVPDKQETMKQITQGKCNCNCKCQTRKELNYEQGNLAPHPQYVIAIPYNYNLSLLR